MDLKSLLLEIEKHTNHIYIEVSGGVAKKIGTGEEISAELFLYHKVPEDGIYKVLEYTCGGQGGCKIGCPAKECLETGIYNSEKCAVYSVTHARNISIQISLVEKILESFQSN